MQLIGIKRLLTLPFNFCSEKFGALFSFSQVLLFYKIHLHSTMYSSLQTVCRSKQ